MKSFYLIAFLFLTSNGLSQKNTEETEPYVKKEMCIILSTKNYKEALNIAKSAAIKLKCKLELGNLKPNKESGLTMPKEECENNGWDYPCYVSRGRWDDGEYISIEYSSAIEGFAKGYYVVITASGDKAVTAPALKKAKKIYKTAYVKIANVFIGCMH